MCVNKRERQTDIMINKTGLQPVSRPEKQTLLGLKTAEGKKKPGLQTAQTKKLNQVIRPDLGTAIKG